MNRSIVALVIVPALLALPSCGGGGGGSGGGNVARADTVLRPFIDASDTSLELYDPAAPASPPVVADNGIDPVGICDQAAGPQATRIDVATISFTNNQFITSNDFFPAIIYIKGGKLFRVSTVRGTSHAPVQFSSITDACAIPANQVGDLNGVNSTRIVVNTGGPDGDCATAGDNDRHIVRITASTSDAGQLVDRTFRMRRRLRNATGGVQGVLAEETLSGVFQFNRYTIAANGGLSGLAHLANLQAGTNALFQAAPSRSVTWERLRKAGDPAFKLVRHDAANDDFTELYTYTGTVSAAPIDAETGTQDATFAYFGDGNQLLKLPLSTTTATAPTAVQTFASGLVIAEIFLVSDTPVNRLVIHLVPSAGGAESLVSLPVNATTSTVPVDLGNTANSFFPFYSTADNNVYFNVLPVAGGDPAAKVIHADGTGAQTFARSTWAASVLTETFAANRTSKGQSAGSETASDEIETILLVGDPASSGNVSVRPADAPTATVGASIGTIANSPPGTASGLDFGTAMVLNAFTNPGSGLNKDAFAVDTDAGTVTPLAQTPGASDCTVF